MRQIVSLSTGGTIGPILTGLVALAFFLEGATAYGAGTIAAGGLIYGLWRSRRWRGPTGDAVPEVQALSPEEAMQLSPGRTIRDGQQLLTVKDTGRDPRRQTESKVIVRAVDEDGKEWGLPITEARAIGPSTKAVTSGRHRQ